MSHVLNNNNTLEICDADVTGSYFITPTDYIIAMPDTEFEEGVAAYGGADEPSCVETIELVLGSDYTSLTDANTAVKAAGGLVFLDGELV